MFEQTSYSANCCRSTQPIEMSILVLCRYVANELKLGRSVPPKTFESATVMFSDIVGFTTICASFSPLDVVNMLNSVYSKFDDIINKNNAYKVDKSTNVYFIWEECSF